MTDEQAAELIREVKALREDNREIRAENRQLRQRLDALARRYFGKKSEQLDPNQLELLLGEMENDTPGKNEASAADLLAEAVEPPTKKPPRRKRKDRFPKDIRVVEKVITPLEVQLNPDQWKQIGEEVSVQYDYHPGWVEGHRTIRPKFVKRDDTAKPPVIAELPPRLIERGMLAPGFLTHIVISKYADHLPVYRQQQILKQRHGVDLSRETMCRGIALVAEWLKLIVQEMSRQQFETGYVQVDETPVKYLSPGAGKALQGYLWTAHVPGGDTVYHWYASRAQRCLDDIVPEEFSGTLQCDGYAAYQAFAGKHDDIELVACWAHTRRYFYDAFEQKDSRLRSGWVIRQIAHLYRIEQELRDSRAGPALRQAVRQSQSRMIIERLHRALLKFKHSGEHWPKSLMGKALDYTLKLWPMLIRYLEDGQLEIDNNLCENVIRPTAIGKKNWLFIGAEGAGWYSAVIFSIITSCRTHGVDPQAYLRDVLERLPSMTNHQIPSITPAAWAASKAKPMDQVS